MADLDQISMMLGEIRSDVKHALQWLDAHEDADQERFEKLSERIAANNGYKEQINIIETTLNEHKPVIEQVRRVKWLGTITAAFVIAASALGANLISIFQGWFDNGY